MVGKEQEQNGERKKLKFMIMGDGRKGRNGAREGI
jgi:hypothetical protein